MSRRSGASLWFLIVGLACCGSAWAHGGLGDAKSIWGGSQHFLTSPLSLAALLGLAAVFFGTPERVFFPAVLLAGVCAGGAAALAGWLPAATAPAAIVAVGLAAVVGWTPPRAAALALAVLGGTAAGLAADLDARSWQGSIGVAAAMMLPLFAALAASEDLIKLPRLTAILPIARRVLGSWVAAMGLLMTALAFHVSRG